MTEGKTGPRKHPRASCPYRQDCPSGLWAASEYDKLAVYDGPTWNQDKMGVFLCHQGAADVCAGWAHVHGNTESLALRLAPSLDPDVNVEAVLGYVTSVPLWPSGAAAAEHGKRDLEQPGAEAREAVRKIATIRQLKNKPVRWR